MPNGERDDRLCFTTLNVSGNKRAWIMIEAGRMPNSFKFWLALCLISHWPGYTLSNSSIKNKYLARICGMLKVWFDFSQSLCIWTYAIFARLIVYDLSVFLHSVGKMIPLLQSNYSQQATYEGSRSGQLNKWVRFTHLVILAGLCWIYLKLQNDCGMSTKCPSTQWVFYSSCCLIFGQVQTVLLFSPSDYFISCSKWMSSSFHSSVNRKPLLVAF